MSQVVVRSEEGATIVDLTRKRRGEEENEGTVKRVRLEEEQEERGEELGMKDRQEKEGVGGNKIRIKRCDVRLRSLSTKEVQLRQVAREVVLSRNTVNNLLTRLYRDKDGHLWPRVFLEEEKEECLVKSLVQETQKIQPDPVSSVLFALFEEHVTSCTSCPDKVDLATLGLVDRLSSSRKDMEEKIQLLEEKVGALTEKLANYETRDGGQMTYHSMLSGVSKPQLLRTNEYTVKQGYRIVDLHVLRLALQSAQACGHPTLMVAEVNTSVAHEDLATQLAFLCSTCGAQTIFATSSFSPEDPPNYSVNKTLLPLLGPAAYFSLVSEVQRSENSMPINVKTKSSSSGIQRRAKLIMSLDKRTYPGLTQPLVCPSLAEGSELRTYQDRGGGREKGAKSNRGEPGVIPTVGEEVARQTVARYTKHLATEKFNVFKHNVGDKMVTHNVGDKVITHNVGDKMVTHNVRDKVITHNVGDKMVTHNVGDKVITHDIGDKGVTHNVGEKVVEEPAVEDLVSPTVGEDLILPTVEGEVVDKVLRKNALTDSETIHEKEDKSLLVDDNNMKERKEYMKGSIGTLADSKIIQEKENFISDFPDNKNIQEIDDNAVENLENDVGRNTKKTETGISESSGNDLVNSENCLGKEQEDSENEHESSVKEKESSGSGHDYDCKQLSCDSVEKQNIISVENVQQNDVIQEEGEEMHDANLNKDDDVTILDENVEDDSPRRPPDNRPPTSENSKGGGGLKLKPMTALRMSRDESVRESKSWTTTEGGPHPPEAPTKPLKASSIAPNTPIQGGTVTPVAPGTKIVSSKVRQTSCSKSNLPPGVYMYTKHNGTETVLIVKDDKEFEITQKTYKAAPSFKRTTPIKLFSAEVTGAIKAALPQLSFTEIQKIVMDRWYQMSETEKQVYKNKLARQGAEEPQGISLPNPKGISRPIPSYPPPNSGLPSILRRDELPLPGPSRRPSPTPSPSPTHSDPVRWTTSLVLPPGWKREVVQRASGLRRDVYVIAPCGKKLRSRPELEKYLERRGLDNIDPDKVLFSLAPRERHSSGGGQQEMVKIDLMNTEGMWKKEDPPFDKKSQQNKIYETMNNILSDENVTEEVPKEVVTIDDDTAPPFNNCSGDRIREEIHEDEPRSEDEVIIDE